MLWHTANYLNFSARKRFSAKYGWLLCRSNRTTGSCKSSRRPIQVSISPGVSTKVIWHIYGKNNTDELYNLTYWYLMLTQKGEWWSMGLERTTLTCQKISTLLYIWEQSNRKVEWVLRNYAEEDVPSITAVVIISKFR